jgi:ribonuclease-3
LSRKRPSSTSERGFALVDDIVVPVDPPDQPSGEDNPERFAAVIDVDFRNLELLRTALTHRSVLHDWVSAGMTGEPPQSNERLEFLGDAVLGYIVAEELYKRFPDAAEGELTKQRVAVVRAEQLVSWAREIRLADYLYLGQGERVTEGARDRMLAGAFEAIVGAVALDRGITGARKFVLRFLRRDRDAILAGHEHANPKGRLQELLQERFRAAPSYRITSAEGPAHARRFTAEVLLNREVLGSGSGTSKREAEQAAARMAIDALPPDPLPEPTPSSDALDMGE